MIEFNKKANKIIAAMIILVVFIIIIILSIIEIPTLIVTLFCMFIKIPQSNSRHIMATALFAFVALIYVLCRKKK